MHKGEHAILCQKYALNVQQNAVLNIQEYAQYANKYMNICA